MTRPDETRSDGRRRMGGRKRAGHPEGDRARFIPKLGSNPLKTPESRSNKGRVTGAERALNDSRAPAERRPNGAVPQAKG